MPAKVPLFSAAHGFSPLQRGEIGFFQRIIYIAYIMLWIWLTFREMSLSPSGVEGAL